MRKRTALTLTAISCAFLLNGCLLDVTQTSVPQSVVLNREFSMYFDAKISSSVAPGGLGILLQIPESMQFQRAYLASSHRFVRLRRNAELQAIARHEPGAYILAFADSTKWDGLERDSVRLIVTFLPRTSGRFLFKWLFGEFKTIGSGAQWKTLLPDSVYSFAKVNDTLNTNYQAYVDVTPEEESGTLCLAFEGQRQYVRFPLGKNPVISSDSSYTVECWLRTTEPDAVVLSTRRDDFNSYYPFELFIDEYGDARISTADGSGVRTTPTGKFVCDGRWHHVAISHTAERRALTLIVDSRAVDSIEVPVRGLQSHTGGKDAEPEELVLSARGTYFKFFQGEVDELRIWNVSHTEDETAFYQNAVLSGYEDNLHSLYNFETVENGTIPNMTTAHSRGGRAFNSPVLVNSSAPLLAEVLPFAVYLDEEEKIVLAWESFDDHTVDHYEIERRTERGKYSVFEKAYPDSGGSSHGTYTFNDSFREDNVYYYRLRRVNKDGSIYYSEVFPIGEERFHNFVLEDNTPDPFVSTTEISYTLSESTSVELSVYNIMGLQIATLVDERQKKGTYTVTFDGTEEAEGLYFYKLETKTGSQTKKMYLSK